MQRFSLRLVQNATQQNTKERNHRLAHLTLIKTHSTVGPFENNQHTLRLAHSTNLTKSIYLHYVIENFLILSYYAERRALFLARVPLYNVAASQPRILARLLVGNKNENNRCGYTGQVLTWEIAFLPRETAFSSVTDVSRGKFPVLNIHGYVKKITRTAHDI